MHDENSTVRIIVKLLRELVTRQRFTEYADLKDALRRKLSKLRIRYSAAEFDSAWPIVASNKPLVDVPPTRVMVERPVEDLAVSKVDAAAALAQIRSRLGSTAPRAMPRVRLRTAREADRVKAAQLIASEIVASVARCEALEREVK